jgi:glutamine cyclotransferase
VTTVVLSIISSETKTHYELRMGKPSPPDLSMTLTSSAPEGVEFLHEYDLNEGGRFVEGLEFADDQHLMMSSGLYGGSFLEILKFTDNL